MVTVETLHFRRRRAASTATAGETAAPGVGRRWTASLLPLHPAVAEIVHDVAVFLFGAGCAQLTTDVGKYTVDRLRYLLLVILKFSILRSMIDDPLLE